MGVVLLRVVALAPGSLTVPAGEHEYLVLPLSGLHRPGRR